MEIDLEVTATTAEEIVTEAVIVTAETDVEGTATEATATAAIVGTKAMVVMGMDTGGVPASTVRPVVLVVVMETRAFSAPAERRHLLQLLSQLALRRHPTTRLLTRNIMAVKIHMPRTVDMPRKFLPCPLDDTHELTAV